MNVEKTLLPLLSVVCKSHKINTKDDCIVYINEIMDALNKIRDVTDSYYISCSNCIHFTVCKIQDALDKNRIDNYHLETLSLAWICNKYYKDPIYDE